MGILFYAGVDLLATLGTGVEMADGLRSLPRVRGKDLLIPFQHGQRATRKYYDERTVVLQGEILASTAIGFDSFIDRLKALFPIESGEQKLERVWADGSRRYLMAEVRNLLVPEQAATAPLAAKWSLELVASDPFWYASALEASVPRTGWFLNSGVMLDDGGHWLDTTAVGFAQTLTGSPVNIEASNSGNYYNRKPIFNLTGSVTNLKITNLRNGYSFQIAGTFASMVIDCGAQTVNGANASVTLGPGQTDWMRLEAGDNTLTIVGASGAAYSAQYSPVFL